MSSVIPGAQRKTGYLASLDGWRAIAIFSVIFAHDPDIHGFGRFTTIRIHQLGWAGVDLFFAISGLLICSRLLEEERVNGRISLRDFYIRRVCRILPAAYLFLAVCLALGFAHQIVYSVPATLAAAFMVRNYWGVYSGVPANELYTDHFWSLSVEEHFYLLLPAVLVFVRRRLLFLSILSAVAFAWFLHFAFYGKVYNTLSFSRTDLRVHGLLIPAVMAILLTRPRIRKLAERWVQPWFWIPLVVVLGFSLHGLDLGAKIAIVGVCLPFMVMSTMIHPNSLATRVLEWQPIRFIGRLSYGMYLWQQIFMIRRDSTGWPFSIFQSFPYNYLGLALCALTSYYLLEKPLIKVGHRLAPPATPGRLDLKEKPAHAKQPRPETVPAVEPVPGLSMFSEPAD